MKNKQYDIDVIATLLTLNSETNIRKTDEYIRRNHKLIDMTMSCTPEEAMKWMEHEMAQAIEEGNGKKNMSLRVKFLAAYDIHRQLGYA